MGKIQRTLVESSNFGSGEGSVFRCRFLSAGQGSSGFYPPEVIERDARTAWPVGTHIYINHLGESEAWERQGSHSIHDLAGVTISEAEYVAEEQAAYANVKFYEHHLPLVNAIKDDVDLSIEGAAYVDDDGTVEALLPSPFNSVAIVPRGGRDGKITALIESYREKHGKIVTNRENAGDERKETNVKPEEIEAVVTGVAEALKPMFTQLSEALTPAAPVVEAENEDAETVDVADVAEALIEAGLPKSGRTRVLEAVKAGTDVAEAVKAEKAYVDEIVKESVTEDAGTVKVTGTPGEPLQIQGW